MSSSNVGDTVLDPFFGTGTTGAVAKKIGRNFIGIERDAQYVKGAEARINEISRIQNDACLGYAMKKRQPRVPFGAVIECGLLKAGDKLFDAKGDVSALIRSDGTLISTFGNGSIHQMGAAAQNAPACNGWMYWHYQNQNKQLAPIDELRKIIREELYPE